MGHKSEIPACLASWDIASGFKWLEIECSDIPKLGPHLEI